MNSLYSKYKLLRVPFLKHAKLTRTRLHLLTSTVAAEGRDKYGIRTTTLDWDNRRRRKTIEEIAESARKLNQAIEVSQIDQGLAQLEALIPGFAPSLYSMKASDWAQVLLQSQEVAKRLVLFKTHYPGIHLSHVIAQRPALLMQSMENINRDAAAVKKLLAKAKDIDRLLSIEPQLLCPKFLLSALVTVTKWFDHLDNVDPIEILEGDPQIILRAQTMDQAFEPVYEDENGNLVVAAFNYKDTRTDWQEHIDKTRK